MARRSIAQRETAQTARDAIPVAQYLDRSLAAFHCSHILDVLCGHCRSGMLTGSCSPLHSNSITGDRCHQFNWYMLGSGLLGSIRDHHGGDRHLFKCFSSGDLTHVQFLKELDEETRETASNNRTLTNSPRRLSRAVSSPPFPTEVPHERQPLIRRRSFEDYEEAVVAIGPITPETGGTILGIHNIAIVLPQFLVRKPRSPYAAMPNF